jgi:tRNA(His) guanylyltransferase
MQESSLNKYENWPKHEIFSKTCIPPETSFFVRLDGWRFQKLSEMMESEKPFDEKFAKCVVSSGKILFTKSFNPSLIYVASDELNILFLDSGPFRRRVEKIDSVLAGLISSAFSLSAQKFFDEKLVAAYDSRVVVTSTEEKIVEYLSWRQMNAWRNHNNAYAYSVFHKIGHKPSEIARRLGGTRTEELHEIMLKHGANLAKTPQWQRRGILMYRQPFSKQVETHKVTRRMIRENWNLPLFTSKKGAQLIHQILQWTKEKRKN